MSVAPAQTGAREQARRLAGALRGDVSDFPRESVQEFVRAAEHHGVTALLWQALRGRGDSAAPLVAALAPGVTAEAGLAAMRERELVVLLRAFDRHEVRGVVTKGAALAYCCYDQPWLRPRTDTDVLIAREQMPRAEAALAGAGYRPAAAVSTGELVSHQVAFERTDDHGISHIVDVHWKALNPQVLADVVTLHEIWPTAQIVPLHGTSLRVPALEWSLVLACLHRLAHHQDQERLGWLFDIHLLMAALDAAGWRRFCEIARGRKVSAICADGLEASGRYFPAAVPSWVSAHLDSSAEREPSRTYTEREVGRIEVLRSDLRHLTHWRDRMRLLREHAFPPASFMMARYASRRRAWLPAFYVHRLVTGAWKWMRA
jgi:hypothetical protein